MTTLAAQIAKSDRYFTRYKDQTSKVEFLNGGPGVHQTGLNLAYGQNRQDPVLAQGFGKVLQEKRLQERQADALADNRTGSPYAANTFVNHYLRMSNLQTLHKQQKPAISYFWFNNTWILYVLGLGTVGYLLFKGFKANSV